MSLERSDERELEVNKKPAFDRDIMKLGDATDIFSGSASLDPAYEAKARILNSSVQEIGMGKYQVRS
jgi:hypothetical protein